MSWKPISEWLLIGFPESFCIMLVQRVHKCVCQRPKKKAKKSISIPREHEIGIDQWTTSLFLYQDNLGTEKIIGGKVPVSYPT